MKIIKLTYILAIMISLGCNNKMKKMEGMSFTIKTQNNTFTLGDSIPLEIRLENLTTDPITINSRLGMGYSDSDDREIYFKITESETSNSYEEYKRFQVDYRPIFPKYKKLTAGNDLKKEIDLNFWYKFPEKGKFKITAIFDQDIDEDAPEVKKIEIVSNEIEIVIE